MSVFDNGLLKIPIIFVQSVRNNSILKTKKMKKNNNSKITKMPQDLSINQMSLKNSNDKD